MDPLNERLGSSPRALNSDAFFAADRSTTSVSRPVSVIGLNAKGQDTATVTTAHIPGFANRHTTTRLPAPVANPLPHDRRDAKGKPDTTIAGWTHMVNYVAFFSASAARIIPGASGQPRLAVKILFGTGTEYFRHGVCGAVVGAVEPTMLIVVPGIEPKYKIDFVNPRDTSQKKSLRANNRWGIGITVASIEALIAAHFGRLVDYDIVVGGAFSTGYLGLHGSVMKRLFPIDRLRIAAIYDCLYGTLASSLDRITSMVPSCQVIAYVATGGGNSFRDPGKPSLSSLILGGRPRWNYVDLIGNRTFHSMTSSRLVSEGSSSATPIITTLPADYSARLTAMTAIAPPRNTVLSDPAIIARVRGSTPAGVGLAGFAADKAHARTIADLFAKVGTTRACIERGQLLGWRAPAGEEWHDMLLVEFAWECLS
ncbi:hypothetical protein QSJ18_08710 [Gordonia sp. ABSL1-1]|uniref:hypothetical protein n=1 Tax=Gordonia sp. ABSL1-1 TaxID=3053923 RepID=UPI0025724C62|nr:hypothetical protein [Gordonia sp. ABSL1-1]MDL9936818.1 hypothetical protein [Gordonia sp. ABSL1-1]